MFSARTSPASLSVSALFRRGPFFCMTSQQRVVMYLGNERSCCARNSAYCQTLQYRFLVFFAVVLPSHSRHNRAYFMQQQQYSSTTSSRSSIHSSNCWHWWYLVFISAVDFRVLGVDADRFRPALPAPLDGRRLAS